jgi:glutathione S-transferase
MKLYASAPSPFARKVRIALIELGLADTVQLVPTVPLEDPDFRRINPLGKIPTLVLDDGTVIYDSLVIVDWLDAHVGGNRLIPSGPHARNAELKRHALANGIIEAAFSITSELRRPQPERSASWIARWSEAIETSARILPGQLDDDFTLANITAAVAADYVPFRLNGLTLDIAPLAAWRQALGPRPSLELTAPNRELDAAADAPAQA